MMKREAKENEGSFKETEISLEAIDEELIESIREEFLDNIFGYDAHIKRDDFISNVVEKTPWILDSESIRKKVKDALAKRLLSTNSSRSSLLFSHRP